MAQEPQNAEIVWENAQLLLEARRTAEGRVLLRKLAEGHRDPKYGCAVFQAKRYVQEEK